MAIDTEKARQKYTERYNNYKTQIDVILQREKNLLQLMEKDSSGIEYKRLALAEDMLNLSSLYLLVHNLSVSVLSDRTTFDTPCPPELSRDILIINSSWLAQ